MIKKLVSMYVVHVAYFLGVGMISSGIVLMPFNPMRYSVILSIGLLLFGTGSFINEFVIDRKGVSNIQALKTVAVSLTLAIGIGMISGGIAHFKESPSYASYLIPLGVAISFVSFGVKNRFAINGRERKVATVALLAFVLTLHLGLFGLAQIRGPMDMGGDIFKHGVR